MRPLAPSAPRGLAALLLCLAAGAAAGAQWDSTGGAAVAVVHTDNVCLANRDTENKTFATVTPDVNLTGRGARANVSLNARLQYNSLADADLDCPRGGGGLNGGQRESLIPSGRFAADLEVVENRLRLLADASATQNAANPFAPGGEDGLNGRGNTNISYRYGAGAVAQRRFDRSVDFNLSYFYNEQTNSAGRFNDSAQHQANGSLGLVPGTRRLIASINGRYSRVEFQPNGIDSRPPRENELASADVRAALQLTDSWQVNGLYGREWNDFLSAFDEIDDTYWDAGLRWAPNSRIQVEAGYGERFFGETPRASVSYRHKRSRLQASYLRTVQFPRNLRAGQTDPTEPFEPDPGELPGDPVTSPDSPTFFGNGPVQNDQFQLVYALSARRTNFSVQASLSEQTRLADGLGGEFRSVQGTASRGLSSRLTASARLLWRENIRQRNIGFVGPGAEIETWTAGLNLTRRFGNDLTVTLAYQYRTQDADSAFNEFDENRITLSTRLALF